MEQQLHLMGPTIKPFQKAMDKLFLRDKFSRNPVPEQTRPQYLTQTADLDGSTTDRKPVQQIDMAFIKRMVDTEKTVKSKQEMSLLRHTKTKFNRESKSGLQASGHNLETVSQGTVSTALPMHSKKSEVTTIINENKLVQPGQKISSTSAQVNQSQASANTSFYVSKKQQYTKEFKEIVGYSSIMNSLQFCFEKRIRQAAETDSKLASIVNSSIPGHNYSNKVRNLLQKVRTGTGGRENLSRYNQKQQIYRGSKSVGETDQDRQTSLDHETDHAEHNRPKQRLLSDGKLPADASPKRIGRSNVVAAITTFEISSAKRHNRIHSKDGGTSRSFHITRSRKPAYRSQPSRYNLFGSLVKHQASLHSIVADDICLSKEEAVNMDKNLDSYILQPYF